MLLLLLKIVMLLCAVVVCCVMQSISRAVRFDVRLCLPGQEAVYVGNSSSSMETHATANPAAAGAANTALLSVTCRMCIAPRFSFTAYPQGSSSSSEGSAAAAAAAASSYVCQACPARGICVAGMVLPSQGCYQPHPRSTAIHECPHIKACIRQPDAVLNLQGLQCSYRRLSRPEEVPFEPYSLLQCSRGYAGVQGGCRDMAFDSAARRAL